MFQNFIGLRKTDCQLRVVEFMASYCNGLGFDLEFGQYAFCNPTHKKITPANSRPASKATHPLWNPEPPKNLIQSLSASLLKPKAPKPSNPKS